ncbi:MAG: polysaccharide biosynthesis/export family protein [Tannerellaceae bacterium]|nr:polysaccharide biosynthesis/export family protein [Tannerellaceae bacterium]
MKIKLTPASGLFMLLFIMSCATPKNITYFQKIDELTDEQKARMSQNYTSQICPDDMLSITVSSSSPDVVTPFNPPLYSYSAPQRTIPNTSFSVSTSASQLSVPTLTTTQQLTSYPVNSDGDITFPVIGRYHAAGQSKQDFENKLQAEVRKYVPDAIVHVKIENYKVTVMGDVLYPGTLPVYNERITILEALGQVGDLTINGSRTNILVVRDNNGIKEYGRVDITDPAVFTSPFYYLRQNDLVYVEPNRAKKRSALYSAGESLTVSIFSAAVTCISTVSAIGISLYNNLKKQ